MRLKRCEQIWYFSICNSILLLNYGRHASLLRKSFGFPQLNRVPFRIVQPREASIRILLLIDRDRYPSRAELPDHPIQVAHAEIDHPLLRGVAEIVAVSRERGENGRAGLLRPWLLAVIRRNEIDAKVVLVPLRHRLWILRAKKQTANSCYSMH